MSRGDARLTWALAVVVAAAYAITLLLVSTVSAAVIGILVQALVMAPGSPSSPALRRPIGGGCRR